MTPPPPPWRPKGSGGWEEKEETPAGRRDSRAGRLTGARALRITGKKRSGVTSSARDVTVSLSAHRQAVHTDTRRVRGRNGPVMSQLSP